MYSSLFSNDLFSQADRMQREILQAYESVSPSIRGFARGYPALNVGGTPASVEIYAFAPGVDPASIEVNLERGLLTVEGERQASAGERGEKFTAHVNERFHGRFHRAVSLPDDIDPGAVTANCRDGVLHISVKRSESAQPRRIEVQ